MGCEGRWAYTILCPDLRVRSWPYDVEEEGQQAWEQNLANHGAWRPLVRISDAVTEPDVLARRECLRAAGAILASSVIPLMSCISNPLRRVCRPLGES